MLRYCGILCWVFILFAPLAAFGAEKRCPPWASADGPILKTPNQNKYWASKNTNRTLIKPRFDELTYYWDQGTWFRMQYGYLNPWNSTYRGKHTRTLEEYIRIIRRTKGYDVQTGEYNPNIGEGRRGSPWFAFWMPSMRYVERNTRWTAYLRPCETGRKPPSKEEYVVRFKIDWPFLAKSESSHFAQSFKNAEKNMQRTGRDFFQDLANSEHSLNGFITGNKHYYIYSDTDELSVRFRCTPYLGINAPSNPLCDGQVWSKKLDLLLYLWFPSDQGQNGTTELWRQPVEATIQLIRSWKLKGIPKNDK